MPSQTVTLEDFEWQGLIAMLAQAQGPGISWATTNPLLNKISTQLRPPQPPQMEGKGNGDLDAQWSGADPERSAGGRAAQRPAKEGRT